MTRGENESSQEEPNKSRDKKQMEDEIHSAHGQITAVHQAHTISLFTLSFKIEIFWRLFRESFYDFFESF